jgi:hypothetical protein
MIFSTYEQHVPYSINEVPTLIRLNFIIVYVVGKPAKTIFKADLASPPLNERISAQFIVRNNEVKTLLGKAFIIYAK